MPTDPLHHLATLPAVADAVAAARGDVDRLLSHRALRRRSAEISLEVGLRAARASAALDGVDLSVDELTASTEPVVQGALRVAAHAGELVSTWQVAPLQALARLHVLAAADAVGGDAIGRPANEAAARRLGMLSDLLGRTSAPAIVVAAIVHGEVLTTEAFGWGSGLVGRAAARLTLVARGLDPKALTAPDVGHARDRAAYVAAAQAYADGDAGAWVVHVAGAIGYAAVDALAICEARTRGGASTGG